jgi:hypothetical protein
MSGAAAKAAKKATNEDRARSVGPSRPEKATMASVVASAMEPTPTGLMSCRCPRLYSMCGGLRPKGLLTTRSATMEPTQATATME